VFNELTKRTTKAVISTFKVNRSLRITGVLMMGPANTR
jgi:hypothetical protein